MHHGIMPHVGIAICIIVRGGSGEILLPRIQSERVNAGAIGHWLEILGWLCSREIQLMVRFREWKG